MTLRAVIWCAVSSKGQAADNKDSLPSQEREARAVCEREGWQVIETLYVPGHSRRARKIDELAAEMRRKGITAFDRLIELWEQKGFDVLVCRDDDRFARSQSIHAYIIEETIERGAWIYTLQSGPINKANFRGRIAIGGYKAAGEVDSMVIRTQVGITKMIEQGFPRNLVPFPYALIRDPQTGKRIEMVVNEYYRPLLDDLATLVLSGISYRELEYRMFDLGHCRPDGKKPFAPNYFRGCLLSPYWWGNTAIKYQGQCGLWAFDASIDPPSGVVMHFDNHQPVYTGDLADELKAELRRRTKVGEGRYRPASPFRFSKLVICDDCGGSLSAQTMKGKPRWACYNRFDRKASNIPCLQVGYIRDAVIFDFVDKLLRQIVDGAPMDLFDFEQAIQVESELTRLERQIDTLERQIEGMIINQATAPDATRHIYDKQITSAAQQLEQLATRRNGLLRNGVRVTQALQVQRAAYEEIKAKGVDWFWQQSDRWINQTLHKLFRDHRLVARDKEIIRVTIPISKRRS